MVLFVEQPFIKLQKILMEGSPKKTTVANKAQRRGGDTETRGDLLGSVRREE